MTDHIETRHKIEDIVEVRTFSELLDRCVVTQSGINRTIMELHYLKDKDFRYIADLLGYSEGAIKKRHRRILNKIKYLL